MRSEPIQINDPVRRFFGAALMAVGALIASLCGLCTLGWIGFSVFSALRSSTGTSLGAALTNFAASLPFTFVIGVLPTGFGVMLFVAGRTLRRR